MSRKLAAILALAFSFALGASAQTMSIRPLAWDVIGLDSNDVTTGPNTFLIGARVCNTGTIALTNVTSTFNWLSANANINLADLAVLNLSTMNPGRCHDFYYNGVITRTTTAWNTARQYQITVTATGAPAAVSTPANRQLYVEKIISQGRNQVVLVQGPTSVQVGGIYTYRVDTKTAPGGYEQLEHFASFLNVSFRILSARSTYTQPTGATNDQIYADACGWQNDFTLPTYRTCIGPIPPAYPGGKAGGDVTTFFTVQILAPTTGASLTCLIYDFSGSSYHYNSDYGTPGATLNNITASAATDLQVTINDSPDPVVSGQNLTYTGAVTNAGPSAVTTTDGAVLTIPIPANTSFVSMAMAGWTCTTSAAAVTCTPNAVLPMGTVAPYTMVVNVLSSSQVTIPATANISSNVIDAAPGNNDASTSTVVSSPTHADLSVTNTVPAVVVAGSAFTYTQTVTNNGPASSDPPTFTTTVPPGSTFVSMTTPAGWSCGAPVSGTITCTASSNMPSGTSASFGLNLTASGAVGTVLPSSATVSSTLDANSANNSATATTTIVAAGSADLVLTVVDAPDPVAPGKSILYTQVITNNGPAPALNVSFSVAVPANTIFSYLDFPFGWTCTTPAPGATGTITCTTPSLAVGATASFPLTVTVPATVATGTIINYSGAVTTTTTDSIPANNVATTTTLVALGTSADISIVKTASMNPGSANERLTYNLRVTNNGPSDATNVTVTDTLPANVTFNLVTSSQGTCSGTTTITCNLGAMRLGRVAIITLVVTPLPAAIGSPLNNTAFVSATETDPRTSNNNSTSSIVIRSPTAARFRAFEAVRRAGKVVVTWRTSFESDNLGFNVYRESGAARAQLTTSPVAGSALMVGPRVMLPGHTYRWVDSSPDEQSTYWIEDIDLNGRTTLHGPIVPRNQRAGDDEDHVLPTRERRSATFAELHAAALEGSSSEALPVVNLGEGARATDGDLPEHVRLARQFAIAAQNAGKIAVVRDGLYRVTRAEMVRGGFDPGSDGSSLQLFADGVEVPIGVIDGGDGRWDAADSFEFYGRGLDSSHAAARTYWLVNGRGTARFRPAPNSRRSPGTTTNFSYTLERKDRFTFFPNLLTNGDRENFYGAVISSSPAVITFPVANLDLSGSGAQLDLRIQGATTPKLHQVRVVLNGRDLGVLRVVDRDAGQIVFPIPQGTLHEGNNDVSLTSIGGPGDVSVVDSLRLSYPHRYAADADSLLFSAPGGLETTITGFSTSDIRVLDVTDPAQPQEVISAVTSAGGAHAIAVASNEPGTRLFQATTVAKAQRAAAISSNTPSSWGSKENRADFVILTHASFTASLRPLVDLRTRQGFATSVVTVEDVYDEFGYGAKSPAAIRGFLQHAQSSWKKAPRFVMLVGDASIDPKNYLGFGDRDFVPTRLIPTEYLKTASDDWLVDFDDDGLPNLYLGRLSVSTPAEADTVIRKLVDYAPAGTRRALLVADRDDEFSFERASAAIRMVLPRNFGVTEVFAGKLADPRAALISGISSGPTVVNYIGHASVELLGKSSFFSGVDVASLTNSRALPLFILMNCLNGYFHDLYTSSLAERLQKASNGGAVAVWASSTLTEPVPQSEMNRQLFLILTAEPGITLGELVARAKAATTDQHVRKSWILFGDPTMRLQ